MIVKDMLELSVVICTHNPKLEFLKRTIDAIRHQSLNVEKWEFLIIDNGSKQPLENNLDIRWHPLGRLLKEEKVGLTQARIRAIMESKGGYILFVDDDNCLDLKYLEIALNTMNNNPLLGMLGAGRILPDYEAAPPSEAEDFMIMLALRNETRSYFSNDINWSRAIPFGAGMVIRRHLALDYVGSLKEREHAKKLGRAGSKLLSGEDVDMALHACDKQYLVGVIPELKLTHIIPKSRLETGYLVRLAAGHAFSHYILGRMWGYRQDYPENRVLKKMRYFNNWLKSRGLSRLIFMAEHQAVEEARTAWNKSVAAK